MANENNSPNAISSFWPFHSFRERGRWGRREHLLHFFPSPSSPLVVNARALPRKTIFSRTHSSSNPISNLTNLPCDDGGDNNNSSSIGMGRWRRRRGRVDEEEEEDAKVINDSGRRRRRRREEGQEEAFSFVLLFARLPGTGIRQVIATAFYSTCLYVRYT